MAPMLPQARGTRVPVDTYGHVARIAAPEVLGAAGRRPRAGIAPPARPARAWSRRAQEFAPDAWSR
ncbi:hypothetical protein [Propionicicella superfundia]|uniref:hypothetical protein n=1 Tax=Propionicicella superfundia TaxID=348582 RepID=UPI0012EB32D1|nr:hypothetical protein [Propionicicella superfundia]